MDLGGPWSWENVDSATLRAIRERLASYEQRTWAETYQDRKNCGVIKLSELCDEAKARLRELKQDDVDELFKIRITKKGRVWGIADRSIVCLLWWDPEHSVYPMNITDN